MIRESSSASYSDVDMRDMAEWQVEVTKFFKVAELDELLGDREKTGYCIVTLPEELPVNESVELARLERDAPERLDQCLQVGAGDLYTTPIHSPSPIPVYSVQSGH